MTVTKYRNLLSQRKAIEVEERAIEKKVFGVEDVPNSVELLSQYEAIKRRRLAASMAVARAFRAFPADVRSKLQNEYKE